jgi:feruloyl esterase
MSVGGRGRGAAPPPAAAGGDDWTLNDEAIRNLGYAQLKKTHDAVMTIVQRVYGERPRFSYFTGTSQGGREALTVAQRYPGDYDGVIANVPIVGFSSLMIGPELIRIHEKPLANWVTRAKVAAIRAEFLRQCDGLDDAVDGVIANYMACRAIFDVSEGAPNRHPWAAKRCANNVDPDPSDTTANACLTDGQISTLEFVYSRYPFATALANGVRSFGMWVPNTDPSGSGLIVDARFKGQEGAAPDAPAHAHLGVLGVTGFLMRDLASNPLDYTEGGPLNARRQELSAILDSTNPDLRAFARRGGRMIVTIGTNDTLASPGAQLDYFQSVIDTMGRKAVDAFARFFVVPQANHGLAAATAEIDGNGHPIPRAPLPSSYERFAVLVDWVERKIVPAMSLTVTGQGGRSMPLCSYPSYPKGTACATDAPR